METADFIKNNISQFLKDELFPRLEMLFEEYNLPGDIVRFNELSINLSVENRKDLKAIKYEIEKQIDRQLKQSIKNVKSSNEIERLAFEKDKIADQTISTSENLNSIFLFFLENGYLPWYANKEEFQKLLSSESLIGSFKNTAFLKKIKSFFSSNETIIDRFVFQLSDEVLIAFLHEITPKLEGFKVPVLNFSKSLKSTERNLFWKSLILLSILEKSLAESALQLTINSLLDKNTSKEVLDDLTQVEIDSENKEIEVKTDLYFFEKTRGEIAVQNAGLILLHPFFKTFFVETEIADKTGLLQKNKLELATQVLHFIATGEEQFFEGNMVLEKFLIGVPLKMPIPNQSLLTDTIRNEVIVLLENVIKNWPALKKTSPAGLCQMFIQRNGKLIQKKNGFKLVVERNAQDVLLERLNWNISMIQLPWKKDLLFVEW